MENKLHIAFLWHMHQPLYKDFKTNRYQLPWVRLHATYSYYDMASILDDFPSAKVTVNLTPSLMWQLQDVAQNSEAHDLFLVLTLKDAGRLSDEDKCFILKNFFSCNPETAIFSLKRYKELFFRRGGDLSKEILRKKIKDFSESDFRDLQVFFNLLWCGFTLKEKDPLVKKLFRKGSGYTEEDKKALLRRQREIVASIIPAYKRLQDEGRIEISTTPYYHPILPLLCGGSSGSGFDFRDDAKAHVEKAVRYYKELFGKEPVGMWPAEGSVSREVIPIFEECGIKWIASDEGVLLETFKDTDYSRDDLIFSPFIAKHDGSEINMVFRDVNISNAISFRYAGMPAGDAADELFDNLRRIKGALKDGEGKHIVVIILDGENPWPYYHDGGKGFLSEVYGRILSSDDLEMVTLGEYFSGNRKAKSIKKLISGSWINRNFEKWIGTPQKNLAWKYFENTRKDLFSQGEPSKEALEELYIAEGSDWFWWYDEFGTELNYIFDHLYRMHLANIYKIMGKRVPDYLNIPIYGQVAEVRRERPAREKPPMMGG